MAKKKDTIDVSENTNEAGDVQVEEEVQPVTITLKEELEALKAEMLRLNVISIGQVDVRISQQ